MSSILITVMINLTLLTNGIFFILPYLIYNPQRLISSGEISMSFQKARAGKRLIPSTARLALKSQHGEICLSVKLVKKTMCLSCVSEFQPFPEDLREDFCTSEQRQDLLG